ncbi:MBL fold metallo-hydrolase [Petrimonas mucosa]|jgi:glyoxylase-like metal-dependent hydrolase (beta-lactamase superfamily II)|uniref:Metal dependent hydrolase n=1 Tax=Petrimonas mucosa TaxID=1642646 RepID=A0A1G4G5J0_9BACT|nr:MBL fold metallo-hydrolase [Petrimonas mucosa]SCM56643.1 Metal dependent hydrolase {ECO:0000313/EMBL:KAJ51954,1} [Petrimonas mucosa]SFU71009.1 Metallo-beta-lactamase superfamily protein [Porphyromonadaceae bacterium KHP3R9]HHT29860.1 MBL fold metallo-hydrolase [Petrimonas mucosa]
MKRYIEKQKKSLRLEQAEKIYPTLSDGDKAEALKFHKTLESVEAVEVNDILENHQILPIGSGIEIISTPGHTEGHISLYVKEKKTLIAGDALVLVNEQLVIPYPQFAYDADKAKESVKNLFTYEIEEIICYHGGLVRGNWKDMNIG